MAPIACGGGAAARGLPSRQAALRALADERFDLLIVGGGAAGTGLALAAAAVGLRTALVERDDFGSGTSSRSTKLLHGGVRYLERAVRRLDAAEFALVREGLAERAAVFRAAPHLARRLAILTPCPDAAALGYYAAGLGFYDMLAGSRRLGPTRVLGASATRKAFPALAPGGLRGGVVYYDGQFDDARLAALLAVSAAERGASVANHVEVRGLARDGAGRVTGALVRDGMAGSTWTVRARAVVNAAGPFAADVAALDGQAAGTGLQVSSGVHVVCRGGVCPPDTGLLIPRTNDGRVLFVLPWLGHTLIGTTDRPAAPARHPDVPERDVGYLLDHTARYLGAPLGPADVRSSWCGLRPLLRPGGSGAATADLSRRHAVVESASGLLTIVGGKWTTYRRIAADALAALARRPGWPDVSGALADLPVAGGAGYTEGTARADRDRCGLPAETAIHLQQRYGTRMPEVAALVTAGRGDRLAEGFPYLEAEVLWAVRREMAARLMDVLARRTRLAFLDRAAAIRAAPRVAALMAAELGWDAARRGAEEAEAGERLRGSL